LRSTLAELAVAGGVSATVGMSFDLDVQLGG
jgi:hypothetical protein